MLAHVAVLPKKQSGYCHPIRPVVSTHPLDITAKAVPNVIFTLTFSVGVLCISFQCLSPSFILCVGSFALIYPKQSEYCMLAASSSSNGRHRGFVCLFVLSLWLDLALWRLCCFQLFPSILSVFPLLSTFIKYIHPSVHSQWGETSYSQSMLRAADRLKWGWFCFLTLKF